MAEAEKPGQDDGSAIGHASSPLTCATQQFDVVLLILFPSSREDNPTPLTSLDTSALHCSPRFLYIQVGRFSQ
jgi:hypothetical protein